jgi:uncharacterized protein YfaS (alpha-2-macroglobulin family)
MSVRLRAQLFQGWLVTVLVALVACGQKQGSTAGDNAPLGWAPFISRHTTGAVSRKTDVHVIFTTDVAQAAGARPSPDVLTIEPAVAGTTAFAGTRELVFEPKKDLEPGRTYKIRVSARGLRGVPQTLAPFEFSFRVQSAQFEVALQGLEAGSASEMSLHGTLTTADMEDSAKVERVLSVRFMGSSMPVTWSHGGDGLTHSFVASGLKRQEGPQPVTVKWDGQPIASGMSGEQQVTIPARGRFLVTDEQALEEKGRKQILVYFSDGLDPKQDLTGLVRLATGGARVEKLSVRKKGNLLTLYPEAEFLRQVTVTLDAGIRNEQGERLAEPVVRTLNFTSTKPQVRFAGKGVILPDANTLSIPFEAVNARSVQVTALRIYENNIPQFLQGNKLDGSAELGRVGRFLWRKTLPLNGPITGSWTRYSLDVTQLMREYPGAMFQLTLRLTPRDSAYPCESGGAPPTEGPDHKPLGEPPLKDQEDGDQAGLSNWDYAQEYFAGGNDDWRHRDDPCTAAYYAYDEHVHAEHNLITTNIGLLAKRDQHGKLLLAATDLRTALPRSDIKLSVRNFQGQVIAQGSTDANGLATLSPSGTPFLLIGEGSGQKSYLKLAAGDALPVSHFEVGGETVTRGIKGFLYGDRGVWRPGDPIYLTLVVEDKDGSLPASHPVTLELYDPRGRPVQTYANTTPVGGFYRFDLKTAADAPTGDWTAKAILGELTFTKHLKVETVMPNRLKIGLDLGSEGLAAGKPLHGAITAQWLTGASAAGLKTDVQLALTPSPTHFDRFADYVFDDPARQITARSETIFTGTLDESGHASFDSPLQVTEAAPGMLAAVLTTRVFERGGAFSINRQATTYAPFSRFVGIRLPKGDVARGMLLTDQQHTVEIASLSPAGAPVSAPRVHLTLYKVEWKWWWDKTGDSLAQYVQGNSNTVVREETVATVDGRGQWKFEIKFPEWGRYFLRACDVGSGHCAGATLYVDWPSWAGAQREQSGAAASVLAITSDKAQYAVGETATVQLPESAQGRALVTLENGTDILESRWIEPKPGNTRFKVPVTAAMAPNVYVAVTLVQPHQNKGNDRPIRLYGVIPLAVTDARTHLTPVLKVADEWKPESRNVVEVSEAHGRPMTYTLAVVDEGLLTLTNFKTPDLHEHFYKKEALGVTTWDLFDDVVGAYGGELERLLALGGSDVTINSPDEARSRFPPVVRFLGPFHLDAGAKSSQQIDMPRYIGAVRVMVVAGEKSAYGLADKSVFVRQPLMLLPTMPRVVGPGEEVSVPVSIFVSDPKIKTVALSAEPDSLFTPVGESTTQVSFTRPEEKLGMLRLKAANRLGKSHVRLTVSSGEQRAVSDIFIDVRSSNPPTTTFESHAVQPGESWTTQLTPHGLQGTNSASLEVSSIPALNLESRLGYLITYPHGCLEQTTSAAFAQLYLPQLLKPLEAGRRQQIEDNIRNGLERLRWFQQGNGSFSYWPGGSGGFAVHPAAPYEQWTTVYAAHFLVEAEKAGYSLPPGMKGNVLRYLRSTAQQWTVPRSGSSLDQAYRLYVLALAGQPEVGAMNRMREAEHLQTTERWVLAAAYKLAGLGDLAASLASGDPLAVDERLASNRELDDTLGSPLRNRAMVLESVLVLGRLDRSEGLLKAIASDLSSQEWYSTQSIAYSLKAIARLAGTSDPGSYTFERTIGSKGGSITARSSIYQEQITSVPAAGEPISFRNTSQRVLFVTVASRGVPEAGNDDASSSGLSLDVSYTDDAGNPIDVSAVKQGTDLLAHVEVKNGTSLKIDNIALTQIFAAGWEIHNDRLDEQGTNGERAGAAPRNPLEGSRDATRAQVDYADIRDDRVLQYFGLRAGESIRFTTRLNAAYRGRYYLPSVLVEAMYDAAKNARTRGRWTEVLPAAR